MVLKLHYVCIEKTAIYVLAGAVETIVEIYFHSSHPYPSLTFYCPKTGPGSDFLKLIKNGSKSMHRAPL